MVTVAATVRDHLDVLEYEQLHATEDRTLARYEAAEMGLYDFVEHAGDSTSTPPPRAARSAVGGEAGGNQPGGTAQALPSGRTFITEPGSTSGRAH